MKYVVSLILIVLAGVSLPNDVQASNPSADRIAKGKQLAFDRRKGNCLACHMVEDGTLPGNAAPPLLAMKARFPDRQKLFDQVWDSRTRNMNTLMPPFGSHGILSKEEIELIVDYIYTL